VTDLNLERGREVYLANAQGRRLRVSLQPAWALQRGSRLTNANRGVWARTQTVDTATSAQGFVGSALMGMLWCGAVALRWLGYRIARRRHWTVSVIEYVDTPLDLPARRTPVSRWQATTLKHNRYEEQVEALGEAKLAANELLAEGFQPIRRPVAGLDS
jgi:hypothetical protein